MAGYKDDKSKVPTEAELEAMLDSESEEDFGQTELEVASVDQRAVLREWTAQDFANIYSRFRPHLERHARRFLRNPSQVDEVVQDAFLYLMVTLPELDSELGVLRFLKWKVRMLCLDVIRASGKAYLSNIDEHGELKADQPEVGSDLERAEDAAIVRMALAKLQPRHREVLIASIYEEKSTHEIAAQVGLNENATRQLMLRARAALRKTLVGDVETLGMSLSQILSIAGRKAAAEARANGSKVLGVFLIAFFGISALYSPSYSPSVQTEAATVEKPQTPDSSIFVGKETSDDQSISGELDEASLARNSSEEGVEPSVPESLSLTSQIDLSPFSPWVMDELVENTQHQVGSLVTLNSGAAVSDTYTIFLDERVWIDFKFKSGAQTPFGQASLSVLIDEVQYTAYLRKFDYVVESLSTGYETFYFKADIAEIYDPSLQSFTATRLSGASVNMYLVVDPTTGQVVSHGVDLAQS